MGNTKLLQVFIQDHTFPNQVIFYKSWIIAIFIKGKYSTPWEYNNKRNGKYETHDRYEKHNDEPKVFRS